MSKYKIDKHIQISKDLFLKLEDYRKGKFNTTISALEYYLEKGMMISEYYEVIDNIIKEVKYNNKKLSYIEKLLEQLFANKGFAVNIDKSKDFALNDFKKNINKDIFND